MGLDEKLSVIEAQGRQMIEELKRMNKTLEAILREMRKKR